MLLPLDLTGQPINSVGKSTYIPCSYHWDSSGTPINLMGKSTYIPRSYYWDSTGQPINSVDKPTYITCFSARHPKWCKTGAKRITILQKHYNHQHLRVYFHQLTVITEFTHNNSTRKSKHITDHFNKELARERFRISFFWTGFRLDLAQWSTIWPVRFPNRLSCIYWLLDSFLKHLKKQ